MTISTLSYIASAVVIIPLIVAIQRRKYLSRELKILFLYLVVSFIAEVLGNVLPIFHKSNHFIINAFFLIEGALISFIFREVFIGKKLKRIVSISISIFVLFCFYSFSVLKSFHQFNNPISIIECLLIISWVFIYYYQLLQKLQEKNLVTLPMFWTSISCLFYFLGMLLVYLYIEIILVQKEPMFYVELWNVYYVLLFIFRILLAIGLWFSKTPLQLKPLSR